MKNKLEMDIVKTLMLGWKETRSLTVDWVNFHSINTLRHKLPRPGLDTFTKHLIEMSAVQKSYVNVLFGGKLDFSKVDGSLLNSNTISKKQLINKLEFEDAELYKAINSIKDWNSSVNLFNTEYPLYYVIELLIRHETFHQGQFIAFCYSMNLQFPESWKDTWALP